MLESWWVGLERFDDRSDTFHRRLYGSLRNMSYQDGNTVKFAEYE